MFTAAHPDCVEYDKSSDVFAVGMYELEDDRRRGGVKCIKLNDAGNLVEDWQLLTDFGVLDLRWTNDSSMVCACSDGSVRLIKPAAQSDVSSQLRVSESTDHKGVVMGVDGADGSYATLTTGGSLSFLNLNEKGFIETGRVQAHNSMFESWSVAKNNNTIVTGSDDCCMNFWDLRTFEKAATNSKAHSMGVTAYLFRDEFNLLSGSYDDQLREWDIRNISQPVKIAATRGGIWRIKKYKEEQILIAACYGGAEIWDKDLSFRLREFDDHKSMVYGISSDQLGHIVSCSFYDNLVCKW